ncbi:MAG: FAD-dependent oxidoreductase, partial [Betaproteobacteria bacterium]|nr:FAD-dependent oxidoreductase [Betaproteobacteria bacterium]
MSRRWHCDIAVIGASLGGVLAAWRASQAGQRVLLVCEEPWMGGQMSAQAVPPDEHEWIELGGAPSSYLRFRQDIRSHYRRQVGFLDQARLTEGTNPGDGWVSRLCFEPVLAA